MRRIWQEFRQWTYPPAFRVRGGHPRVAALAQLLSSAEESPFSNRSQDLPFLELPMPAAIVQAPAASASIPICTSVPLLCTNVRRVRDPSGRCIKKFMTEYIASRTPHNASSHQFLIIV